LAGCEKKHEDVELKCKVTADFSGLNRTYQLHVTAG